MKAVLEPCPECGGTLDFDYLGHSICESCGKEGPEKREIKIMAEKVEGNRSISDEKRESLIAEAKERGVAVVAKEAGLNQVTIYRWLQLEREKEPTDKVEAVKVPLVKCGVCGQLFKGRQRMAIHFRWNHSAAGKKAGKIDQKNTTPDIKVPTFPEFNESWSPTVQIEWLKSYTEIYARGK